METLHVACIWTVEHDWDVYTTFISCINRPNLANVQCGVHYQNIDFFSQLLFFLLPQIDSITSKESIKNLECEHFTQFWRGQKIVSEPSVCICTAQTTHIHYSTRHIKLSISYYCEAIIHKHVYTRYCTIKLICAKTRKTLLYAILLIASNCHQHCCRFLQNSLTR